MARWSQAAFGRPRDCFAALYGAALSLFSAVFFAIILAAPAQAQVTTNYPNTTVGSVGPGFLGAQNCITRTFDVTTNIIIGDVDIGIIASTTSRGTVSASLTAPGGGGTVALFPTSGVTAANINARLDASAGTTFTGDNAAHNTATPPYQFTRSPSGSLAAFNGFNAFGTWTLQYCVTGLLAPTSTLSRAELFITSIVPAVSDLSLAKTVANPSPASGGASSYTLTLSSAAGWVNASNVTVRDILPAGATFVSATGSGGSTYNSGTGIWTIPTINTGSSQTLTINFTVGAAPGATVTNIAEIVSSPNFDFDSTPNNGVTTEDDYSTVNFTAGARLAGTPPTLVCPVGSTVFDWDARAWATGSLNNNYTVAGLGTVNFAIAIANGIFVNNATYGGQSPTLQAVMTGGFTPAQNSLVWITDFATQSATATNTITLPTAVPGAQFRIFDVDANVGQYADRVSVIGRLNGVTVNPTLTNGVTNFISGGAAIGDAISADGSANGNIVITFAQPIDTIIITYGNHTTAPADPGNQATTLHDITFCNPQATITAVKTSSVVSDAVSVTNPKAVPGAVIRYCILVTNPGSATTTTVIATDTLPANVTFVSGSMRSGTTCAGATTVEDDNNTGADESDTFGMSITGTTIAGITASLAPTATFAMVFNATVN